MELSLIEKISHDHSESIAENWKNGNKNKAVFSVDSAEIEHLLRKYWSKISVENISLEVFIKGIDKVSKSINELWKSYEEILWVQNYSGNENTYFPNVYIVINIILKNTEKANRHKYFHQLTTHYYNTLTENLKNKGINLQDIVSKFKFEDTIDRFLPCVKLDILNYWLKHFDECVDNAINDTVAELAEFFTCSDVLREDCYKILEKLHCLDCESFSFQLNPINSQFGNLGHYYKLKLTAKYSNEVKEFQFFAKTPPVDNEVVRNLALPSVEKEEFFYNTYISELEEFGFQVLVDFAPEVYFVRKNNILILEDLEQEDYKPLDIRDPKSYEIMAMGLKKLAELHASSLLLEEKKSKIYGRPYRLDEKYGEYLKETLIFKENPIIDLSSTYAHDFFPSKFLEILKGEDLKEFQIKASVMYESVYQLILKSPKYRNVMNHGDPWAGNILYRMALNHLSCRLIDFQLIRYAPPLTDVLMFLYIQTDKQFRDIHLKDLLDFYRKCLGDNLKRFNVDINDIYDKKTFDECFEDLKPAGIILGIFYNLIFTLPTDINPYRTGDNEKKMDFVFRDRSELYEAGLKCDIFKNRIKGYIEDMYNFLK